MSNCKQPKYFHKCSLYTTICWGDCSKRYYFILDLLIVSAVKTACEHDTMHISCPTGSIVHVISAFYGRLDRTTCPHSAMQTTSCTLPGITDTVRAICQDKAACDVSGPFTNPCANTYKYLKVTYECRRK